MSALLCKPCRDGEKPPTVKCDGEECDHIGCAHFITASKAAPGKDLCGPCKLKLHNAAKKAAKAKPVEKGEDGAS